MRQHVGIIERAFELARRLANIEEIRTQLRKEGYSNVDAHLVGRKIRSDLVKILRESTGLPNAVGSDVRALTEGFEP